MEPILAISMALQWVAVGWAGYLLWRMRDWRVGLLLVLLVLMALRRVLHVAEIESPGRLIGPMPVRAAMEGVVLAISVMSVAAIGFLHRFLHQRAAGLREVSLLASALADSATAMLITDANPGPGGLRIEVVNQAMLGLTGFSRGEMVGRTLPEVFGLDAERDTPARVKSAVACGQAVVTECTMRRKDGTNRWVACSMSPIRSATGKATHLLWVKHDITERKETEQKHRAALLKLSFHVDNSPLAVIEWDNNFRVAAWSSGAERIFGWKAEEVLGKHPDDWRIVYEADAEKVAVVIDRLNRGAEPRNLCLNRNYTRGGGVIWCQWYNSVLFDDGGQVDSVLSLAQDVTERHLAEERQRLLMLELDHRVKNNLAMVLGIAQQSLAATASPEAFGKAFVGRVEALGRAHGLLAKASWEGVDLRELCERVLEPAMLGATRPIVLEGDGVRLSSSQGSLMALTMHELMTNAMKHGSLSAVGGTVHVRWTIEASGGFPSLRVDWTERGGPAVSPPVRSGFGTTFITTGIAYELQGSAELSYDVGGLRCRISFPMLDDRRGVGPAGASAGGVA